MSKSHFLYLIATSCLLLLGCESSESQQKVSMAVLDLRDQELTAVGPVSLTGTYGFFPGEHLDPGDARLVNPPQYVQVPSNWNHADSSLNNGTGLATYFVNVLLQGDSPRLALKFNDIGTSYAVYANGVRIAISGAPGRSSADTEPGYRPQVIGFDIDESELNLVIHVSNFHHRRGGIWDAPLLGSETGVQREAHRVYLRDLFILGAILAMALYHLAFYLLGRRTLAGLYFGIFTILIAIRMVTTDEIYLVQLFPEMSWALLLRLEYISFFLAVPAFALYYDRVFTDGMSKLTATTLTGCGILFSLLTLVLPPLYFSHLIPYYQVIAATGALLGMWLILRNVYYRRRGAIIIGMASLAVLVAMLNDILDNNQIIHSGEFIPMALPVFVLAQALLLAVRFSHSYRLLELEREVLYVSNHRRGIALAEQEHLTKREQAARHVHMVDAMALMAGGLAHDLNNLLSGIVTYPEVILSDLNDTHPLYQPVKRIRDAGNRMVGIVKDLSAFASPDSGHAHVINLNQEIQRFIKSQEYNGLLSRFSTFHLSMRTESNLLNTQISKESFNRLLFYLIFYAAESHHDGGPVTVTTQNRYIDSSRSGYDQIPEGEYVVLGIHDRGKPLSKRHLERLFEPFYAKRITGRSSGGLGLALVWRLTREAEAYLDVATHDSEGTRIEVYFRALREARRDEVEARSTTFDLQGRGETVLIVDDVKLQRQIASELLGGLGYHVDTVSSGEAAISYLQHRVVHIVVLDMILEGGIDGLSTLRHILALHPNMRVIIATGYAEQQRLNEARAAGANDIIRKPYTIESLGRAIKQHLSQK